MLFVLFLSWAEAQSAHDTGDLPAFSEMANFCKNTLEEIARLEEAEKFSGKNVQMPKTEGPIADRIHQIYNEELADLCKVASDATQKFQDSGDRWHEARYIRYLMQLGLFDKARDELRKLESRDRRFLAVYHQHMAFLERWLGNEQEHQKHIDQSKKAMDTFSKSKGGGKINQWAEELKQQYELKYMNWVRFANKLDHYRGRAKSKPEDVDAWRQLGDHAYQLGYRHEEIVAWRVLYEIFGMKGEVAQKLARAYGETDQDSKSKGVLKK
jgi:tetratricopeptide (TPR) repeat protein